MTTNKKYKQLWTYLTEDLNQKFVTLLLLELFSNLQKYNFQPGAIRVPVPLPVYHTKREEKR
jgi:hypothetical protein